MNDLNVQAWIAALTGNLQLTNISESDDYKELAAFLRQTKITDPLLAKFPAFSFEKNKLTATMRDDVQNLRTEINTPAAYKVFKREVPLRSTQLKGSVPAWAAGAAPAKTLGPFINSDGKRSWYDFYLTERMVALYFDGQTTPAIIFNIDVNKFFSYGQVELLAPARTSYDLSDNSSVWIRSILLCKDAPAGSYTGLTITSGTINISAMPVVSNNKTNIVAGSKVTVSLQLKQQAATDADAASPYGTDARAATFSLPSGLQFNFTNTQSDITNITDAAWNVYGQSSSFTWSKQPAVYNSAVAEIFIPFAASVATFSIQQCLSQFAVVSGSGAVVQSYWSLPVTQLDVAHISAAAGIGGLAMVCGEGLSIKWTGLKNGSVRLNNCVIGAQPGAIGIVSFEAGNSRCRQNFAMWADANTSHSSLLKISFESKLSYQFFSLANGYETIGAAVDANIEADRPVDVAAKPVIMRTKNSVFGLIAGKDFKVVTLYDLNMLEDNLNAAEFQANPTSKTISLALENALFTTSETAGCYIAGQLSNNWNKIEKGALYASFYVYKYIPVLPDPYVANISAFRNFRDYKPSDKFSIHVPIMVLLCTTEWDVNATTIVNTRFDLLPFTLNIPTQQSLAQTMAYTNISGKEQNNDGAYLEALNIGRDVSSLWDNLFKDNFALVDVSSKVNQLGISFGYFGGGREGLTMYNKFGIETTRNQLQSLYNLPFKIDEMRVTSPGLFVRSFFIATGSVGAGAEHF